MSSIDIHVPADRRGLKVLWEVRKDRLKYFLNLMQQEGSFAWLSVIGKKVLMLNDATGIQYVLQDNAANYQKSKFYRVLRPFLGNSLLLSEGTLWKKQRQDAAPAFAARNFEDMSGQMIAGTEAMFQRWEKRVENGQAIDLNFETMCFTLDVLLRALFHEAKDGIAADMQVAIITLLREAEERVWSPFKLPQSITFLLPKYKSAMRFLDKTIEELVAVRRKNLAYPEDLLSRLLASYDASPRAQRMLRDQVMTFLLAGHETTANGLVWACYYLSLHPEVQRKMMLEVDEVLQGKTPTLESIRKLVYTNQVFEEVLRIHPIVWTLSRDAQSDDKIPLDDGSLVEVPQGTSVMLCSYAVQRRSKYWENPEAFDPDRFSPEVTKDRPKFASFAFGGGPRVCIGMRFARVESIIALAMLAQRYQMSLVPGQDTKPVPTITLRPNGKILFQLTKRRVQEHTKAADVPPTSRAGCPFHEAAE